jgi:predicted alpha/beta hydrolase family esterase
MKTFILPGFSPINKGWAEEVSKNLTDSTVIEWTHWTTNKTDLPTWADWMSNEVDYVSEKIDKREVNILAKSIGTLVAMYIIKEGSVLVNKLILCGIPLNDLSDKDKEYYSALKSIPSERLLCIQNSEDNHGSYNDVKTFVDSISTGVRIISKPADTHDYPYIDVFKKFLD